MAGTGTGRELGRDRPGERSAPPEARRQAWNTDEVRPHESFAYYREAICQAFMSLTPECASPLPFQARVEAVRLGAGAVNRVWFPNHTVKRAASDIAASTRSCYYLNLNLGGRSHTHQAGNTLTMSPGQIGIFDSNRLVEIDHDPGSAHAVASFWVPHRALDDRLPASFDFTATRISDDPVVGHLIVETARTLNAQALALPEPDGARLFDVLLDLVALALSRPRGDHVGSAMAAALGLKLRRVIHERLRRPDLCVRGVAAAVGISERYVHKLFERTGTSFSRYVMERRLDGAAADLRDPAKATLPVGSVAFDWGFVDVSHFARRFRMRFGCAPREWRGRG